MYFFKFDLIWFDRSQLILLFSDILEPPVRSRDQVVTLTLILILQ